MTDEVQHAPSVWNCPICKPQILLSMAETAGYARLRYRHDVAFVRQSDGAYQPPYGPPSAEQLGITSTKKERN